MVSFDPGPLPFGLPPSLSFLPGEALLANPDLLPSGSAGPSAVITFDRYNAPFGIGPPPNPLVLP